LDWGTLRARIPFIARKRVKEVGKVRGEEKLKGYR